MQPKFPAPIVAVLAAVLMAVGLQVSAMMWAPPPTPAPDLEAAVPAKLAGWTVKTEALGSTPEASSWVAQTLNFDQAVQRSYTRGAEQFTIFAAYWNRGKMPARSVAIHTPDCCWTDQGYVCSAMKFRQVLAIPGVRLQPAEWRVFRSPAGETLHTFFWQVVAGRAFDFGGKFNGVGDPWIDLKAFATDALQGCREQIFVTIAGSVPFEVLQTDPGFQEAMRRLGAAGLADGAHADSKS